LKNITSYLEAELHLPVELFNPLKEMLYDAKRVNGRALDETGSIYTTAAGIAISEPRQIEFLPAKEPLWSKIPVEKVVFVLVPLLTALILLGIVWHKNGQVTALQKERNEKIIKVARLEDLRAKLAALKEKEVKIKQDLSLFPSSVAPPVPYRKVLKEVNEIIPGNVTLTHLEVQAGAAPLKKPPQASKPQEGESGRRVLHLGALAFGNDIHCLTAIAQIIEGLERSPLFSRVKLISTGENKLYNQLAVEFDIVCDINIPDKGKD
jgi:Tfp pilus assembly protein PilN